MKQPILTNTTLLLPFSSPLLETPAAQQRSASFLLPQVAVQRRLWLRRGQVPAYYPRWRGFGCPTFAPQVSKQRRSAEHIVPTFPPSLNCFAEVCVRLRLLLRLRSVAVRKDGKKSLPTSYTGMMQSTVVCVLALSILLQIPHHKWGFWDTVTFAQVQFKAVMLHQQQSSVLPIAATALAFR